MQPYICFSKLVWRLHQHLVAAHSCGSGSKFCMAEAVHVARSCAAAWGYLLACESQVQRKQMGLGHRGAGLDWTSYNLLACRTDVSSGRTEAGMRRLKPSTIMVSQSRGGAAHIVSAWHPCWSSRNSAAATMHRHTAAAKTLASSDCGCTSFYGVEPRPGGTVFHCLNIYNPLARLSPGSPRRCMSEYSISVQGLVWLKKTRLELQDFHWTHRRSDPSDVRSSGFSTGRSHHGAV